MAHEISHSYFELLLNTQNVMIILKEFALIAGTENPTLQKTFQIRLFKSIGTTALFLFECTPA